MNLPTGRSGFIAAVICLLALAACDAVKDIREEPSTAAPPQLAVLGGSVSGLGNRRPVFLRAVVQYPDASKNVDVNQPFFGITGQPSVLFTFGSREAGGTYTVTVKTQPFGKVCTVANGTGVLGDSHAAPVAVTCDPDTTVPRFDLTVNIQSAASSLSNLVVRLTTEDGIFEMPGSGLSSVIFTGRLFNSLGSAPAFRYFVSAYVPNASGTPGDYDNCAISASTNQTSDAAGVDTTVPPTGSVNTPNVTSCRFTIGGNVGYSQQPGVTYAAQTIAGLRLGLRNATGAGNTVATYDFPTTTIATPGTATTAFTFGGTSTPTQFVSNARAVYELFVAQQPTNMFCVTGNTAGNGNGSLAQLATTAVGTAFANISNLAVRCRATPGTAANAGAVLTGAYQLNTSVTTTTATTGTGAPVVTTTTVGTAATPPRQFLTFFNDGTFLMAIHGAGNQTSINNNVEHGFYYYNTAANPKTIAFTIITDANNSGATQSGMSASPAAAASAFAAGVGTATNVTKTAGPPGTLSLTFNSTATSGTAPNITTTQRSMVWTMTEPDSIPGQQTGAWATLDHNQVWIFKYSTAFGLHAGVNGMSILQDFCFVYDDPEVLSGSMIRRGAGGALDPTTNTTNCNLGGFGAGSASIDVPNTSTTPAIVPGFLGRFPTARLGTDNRSPSPILFTITPGSPDTLVVQETLTGAPVNTPPTYERVTQN